MNHLNQSKILDVEDVQKLIPRFGIWDYVCFVAMLVVCAIIGIYFGLKKSRTNDAVADYFMGNRKMSVFPITLSLIASLLSGIGFISSSTETYFYGTKYFFAILALISASIIAAYVFLPVFYGMKLSSTYEYLEKRFDKKMRLFGSVAFVINMMCTLPILIFVAALSFNQVTGVDVQIISTCVCIVCIFYTTIGGIKAVVWTDVFQTIVMFGALAVVFVKGLTEIGGIQVVWERSLKGGRLEFPSFQFDFTDRYTIWSTMFGTTVIWLQSSFLNQNMIQRYIAVPTLTKAKRSVLFFTIGTVIFSILTKSMGLLVYSKYHDCDPSTTKLIRAKDQLFPLFVMQVLGDYAGLPGLFIAGIFSASLSTLSTGLNSISIVVLEDFIKLLRRDRPLSDRATNIIVKSITVITGIICVALVFVVSKLGTLLQLTLSLNSISNGPAAGVFIGGMLLPWMNANGAFYGGLIGLAFNSWVVIGAQKAMAMGHIRYPTKSLSVDGCNYLFNATYIIIADKNSTLNVNSENYVFPLYKLGYLWYAFFGALVTLTSGMLISYFSGLNDPSNINPLYVSPVIRKYLPKKRIEENNELLQPI